MRRARWRSSPVPPLRPRTSTRVRRRALEAYRAIPRRPAGTRSTAARKTAQIRRGQEPAPPGPDEDGPPRPCADSGPRRSCESRCGTRRTAAAPRGRLAQGLSHDPSRRRMAQLPGRPEHRINAVGVMGIRLPIGTENRETAKQARHPGENLRSARRNRVARFAVSIFLATSGPDSGRTGRGRASGQRSSPRRASGGRCPRGPSLTDPSTG